jgi:hypothetical protein
VALEVGVGLEHIIIPTTLLVHKEAISLISVFLILISLPHRGASRRLSWLQVAIPSLGHLFLSFGLCGVGRVRVRVQI